MPGLAYRNPVDGYGMVLIPREQGFFGEMAWRTDAPRFRAEIGPFYIGLYCVTNAQYATFLNTWRPPWELVSHWIRLDADCHLVFDGTRFAVGRETYANHPIVQVTWWGAIAYCEWAELRLPRELEWERAARGEDDRPYPWGRQFYLDRCRHYGNRGSDRTCAVDAYAKGCSPYGLYNMAGNVWEWCADTYDAEAYARYAAGHMDLPASPGPRVVRGGAWDATEESCLRCSYRAQSDPDYTRLDTHGFRCALTPPDAPA